MMTQTRPAHSALTAADSVQHPDAARIILQLEQGHAEMNRAGLGDANLDAFHAEITRQIAASDDPKATLDAFVRLMRDHRAGTTA